MNKTQVTKLKHRGWRVIYIILLVIRAILFPLSKIPFVIIIILLGYYALAINDQGQDLMAVFTAKSIWNDRYLIFFEVFLLCWAISIWNVARILLTAANLKKLVETEINEEELKNEHIYDIVNKKNWVVASVDPMYKKVLTGMIEWTPRVLAMCPYIIFIVGYQKQARAFESVNTANIVVIVIIAILHMFYMIFRKWLWSKLSRKPSAVIGPKEKEYPMDEQKGFADAVRHSRMRVNTIFTILMTIIMFGYSLSAANSTPSLDGKPGLIILTGFTVYTLFGLVLNLLMNRYKVPVFAITVFIAVFFFSKSNNNHSVQTLQTPSDTMMLHTRIGITDSAYASYWMGRKLADSTFNRDKKNQTVFIVAAEGGGIRNCYWTYRVLDQLQKANPKFYDRTFAATGVSGGSIGLGFYYNYKYFFDQLIATGKDKTRLDNSIDTVCSADYLSRVTYGFIFPDLVQRFLPWPFDSWDRSKFLANSFDDAFSGHLSKKEEKLLTNNYLAMWSDTATAYKHPVVLFNTIFNEDGIKAIFSPYRLSDTYYTSVMDILYETNRSVPMKEAMVSSARFPILTAPGLLWHDTLNSKTKHLDPAKLGHISDGGGYENTAIHTAAQTALLLQSTIDSMGLKDKVIIKIIYIGTGTDAIEIRNKIPAAKMIHEKAIGKAYEIAWLNGAVNTIFGWIKGSHNLSTRLNRNLSVLQFGLKTRNKEENLHTLPLGWFLSDTSKRKIMDQSTYRNNSNNAFNNALDSFKTLQ
ncbi:MAG: hypothetical protein ABI675_16500 [Chitinophagaceae bacterium]